MPKGHMGKQYGIPLYHDSSFSIRYNKARFSGEVMTGEKSNQQRRARERTTR